MGLKAPRDYDKETGIYDIEFEVTKNRRGTAARKGKLTVDNQFGVKVTSESKEPPMAAPASTLSD